MKFSSLLPKSINAKLFGEREKYGKIPYENDKDWDEWLTFYYGFYSSTQKTGVSAIVNHSGYKILKDIPLDGKVILEIGPGDLPHVKYWSGKPRFYHLCDIRENFLIKSNDKLDNLKIRTDIHLLDSDRLPIPDQSVDIVICFYVLEHLAPMEKYLSEIIRILKPGGQLVAGIPTEGGILWGLGRYFSSRRYIKKHSSLNPDKIICWEHPNFASEIIESLNTKMQLLKIKFWPFWIKIIDFNLIISFIYTKK